MARVVWANDIHLDFLDESSVDRFLQAIAEEKPDAVLLGGDISTARSIEKHLRRCRELIDAPVCFVLGNHDYYHGSIVGVRDAVRRLTGDLDRLHWLNESGVFRLTEKTALIGHDGWGDARVGDFYGSPVELSDFFLIDELCNKPREAQVGVMRQLGDESAAHIDTVLPEALKEYKKVILLTHVPPFRETSWYDGAPSNDHWAPFFTNHVLGERLMYHMASAPDRELVVLCGHTHGEGTWAALPNLEVVTGGAVYRKPQIQRIMEID